MTRVDDPTSRQVPAPGGDGDAPAPSRPARARRFEPGLLGELLLTVEVSALAAFAFSRPVLDSFGRSPETFVARGATGAAIVGFGLVVTVVPIAVAALVGAIARLGGAGVRWWVHVALVTIVGGLAVWRLGQDVTGWPGDATKLILAGLVGGPLLALLRVKLPASRTFLRYAGAASVIFLVQFLVMSPASSLIGRSTPGVDADTTRTVAAALGDEAPPIVFVVTDTFPTQALMDGGGQIDADLYPNLAELAGTSTWYRNSTSVSGFTNEAVPAMLSGLYPEPSERQQFVVPYPHNLFTLFGGVYDMHVHEPMTNLCPEELCPRRPASFGSLLGDAVDLWWSGTEASTPKLDIPGLFLEDRYADLERWIDDQDFTGGGRPDLFFYHAMLPHEPWHFLPDGTVYEASDPPAGIYTTGWLEEGPEVGWQRLVLQAQATDRLLGRLFDRMREAGTFDDALIVVAGDHGQAFVPGEPWRAVSEGNYEQILWAPLIVKAPGQTEGEVNDDNIETIDVLPTIADRLGFDLPWDVDGIVAGGDETRDPDVKHVDDVEANPLRADEGEPRVTVDARRGFEALLRADAAEGTGPDAAWQRTPHGALVGREVAELDVGDDSGRVLTTDAVDRLDGVDTSEPLPLEVIGRIDGADDGYIALALNGRVAAVTEIGNAGLTGRFVHGLLHPDTFVGGDNELTAFVIEGGVGAEVLRPVAVQGG